MGGEEHSNADVTRRLVEAFNARDVDTFLELMAPEGSWTITGVLVESGTFYGHQSIRDWFARVDQEYESVQVTVDDLTDRGDRQLAAGSIAGRTRWGGGSGSRAWWVVDFANGKVVRGQEFLDKRSAISEFRGGG